MEVIWKKNKYLYTRFVMSQKITSIDIMRKNMLQIFYLLARQIAELPLS